MGLTDNVAALASRHAHALLVEVPGQLRLRATAEQAIGARGWRLATSPADADVLVVCGKPGPALDEAVKLVWEQMPGPRVRVDVQHYTEVVGSLDGAQAGLLDTKRHRQDGRNHQGADEFLEDKTADHSDMDHSDMDHSDMEMLPHGLPLAEGGEDRDGLEMDVLNVHLGPVLAHWPAGLVLRCSLQGDLITEAETEVLDLPSGPSELPTPGLRRLDNVVSVLSLAGWTDAADQARMLRDLALDDDSLVAVRPGLERLGRRVRRSRLLRWSLRGVRPVSRDEAQELGLPVDLCGDTYDRLVRMLAGSSWQDGPVELGVEALVPLVTQLDLATARLVVASLDIQSLHAQRSGHEVPHA